jgi:PAS domain S-box-containing protein
MENNLQKYKDLFDTMELGVLYHDIQGRIIDANHAAEQILGLTRDQLTGMNSYSKRWKSVKINGSPFPDNEQPAMIALKTGKRVKNTVMGIHNYRLNQLRWISIDAIPEFRKGEKKVYQVYSTFYDITDSKKLEENLLIFKSAVELSSNAIRLSTSDGKLYFQNKAFDNLFGNTGADSASSLYADKKTGQEVYRTITSGREWNGEVEMYGKNREKLTIRLRAYALKDSDGIVIGLVAAHTDITQRKKVEMALLESEEKFRNLAEESPNMIFINHRGQVVYANKACEKYTKYKIDELYDDKFNFLSLIHQDDIQLVKENFIKHQRSEKVPPYEYKLVCKDGSMLDVIITTKLINYQKENAILGIVTDTTKLKKAEEQLRLVQFGIDKSQIGVFQVDDDGSIYYVNEHACRSLGYCCDELYKMKIWDIDPNLDEDKWYKHRKKTSRQGNTTIESIHKRKDGTLFPVEIAINFIEFRNKKTSFSFARDITDRKQAEKALRESEERLKLAVEGTKAGLWDWNIQTGETTYDERWADIVGYSLDELKPLNIQTWEKLCHPEDLKKSDEHLHRHFKGELDHYEVEIRMKHKNGHWIWVLDRGKVSQRDGQGNPLRITGTHIDVTERKKAEEEFRLSEERFRRIFEEGQFGITIAGPDYKFIDANPAFCRMIGYSKEKLRSKTFADITHPEHVEGDKEMIIALSKGEITQYKTEKRYVKKNGEILWGSLISTPVRDNEGKIIYYLAMVQDITDRKKTEESLHQQNKEYQSLNEEYMAQNEELIDSLERIQKINIELMKAKEKAEESDRLKTAFLANMSHEIRTPMNGIIGFTDLLKEPKLSGKQQKAYIDVIQQSGYRMLNIINDLIDIARIEAGQVEVKMEDTYVNNLLDGIYSFFKPEAEMKKLSFTCKKDLPVTDSFIRTDATKLHQILTNLIKNALKFTRTGSIDFGYSIKNSTIEFFVKDSGIGIAPELKDKIFERFRRGDISDTTEYEGAGLGLSITKAFVEMLGGKIWLESQLNKGTTFFFSLPFSTVRDSKKQKIQLKKEPGKSQVSHTVLVVEDDETSFLYLKEILYRNGLKVIRAINGEEAVHLTEQYADIELVLMDIKMPVMNGLDATRLIKQLRPDLPVIAETAYASPEDRQRSIEMGCDDFLSKPISKELLMEKIKSYISA